MSKINIGVGDEFPLDESPAGEDRGARRHHHHRHHRRHFRHHHHHRPRHPHLPLLIIAAALIAVLIGAAKISLLATHAILVMAGLFVLLAALTQWYLHRPHRHGQEV